MQKYLKATKIQDIKKSKRINHAIISINTSLPTPWVGRFLLMSIILNDKPQNRGRKEKTVLQFVKRKTKVKSN